MWWRDAVVYQIYPRSFQDSDGDGVGDLRGIAERLDYLAWLGVDAFWLSPFYPSPLADFGYDIADYTAVDPQLGSLADFDELVAAAHERGLRVLLDLIPGHTSIEHPWFREHPDWYIWSPVDGPPNNWVSAFGGPAWARDERSGRWYLHSFYPEQADLDWRNPEVVEAMQGVVRFWLERGVDGFRVDAIDRMVKDAELRDEPPATSAFPFPLHPDAAVLERRYSVNRPEVVDALRSIREAAGDAAPGRRGLRADLGAPALPGGPRSRLLVRVPLLALGRRAAARGDRAGGGARPRRLGDVEPRLRPARHPRGNGEPPCRGRPAAHAPRDGLRLPGRRDRPAERPRRRSAVRPGRARRAASPDGLGREPDRRLHDRGCRGCRHSTRRRRNVESQRRDPSSLLALYRRLLELRRGLGDGFRLLDAEPGVLAYERGDHLVAVNTTSEQREAPGGKTVLATHEGPGLPPHSARIVEK